MNSPNRVDGLAGFLIFVFLVTSIAFIASIPSYKSYKNCAKEHLEYQEKHPEEQAPRVFFTCEARFIDEHEGVVTAFATWIIALFTIALVIATFYLWDAGERQLSVTEKAAKAAEVSANRIINTERAWVLVHQIEPTLNLLTWIGDPAGVIFGINWGYKNYGKSPAFVTKVSAELLVFEAGTHPSPSDFSDKESLVSEIPFAPGFSREINWVAYERGITEQDRLAFVARQRGLFFIGVVEYRDIFGSPHETRFCLLYEQDPGLKNPPFAWRYYGGKEYNDHT